jgi:uncharacterized protein involved in oxidation of intracellular sulfur
MNILIIINDAPYGTDKAYNALRLALTLKKQDPAMKLGIFLLADAVGCGLPKQNTPSGYYNVETMLKSIISKGVPVKACGMCMEARGMKNLELIKGVEHSNMIEFAEWVKKSEKIITF